MAKIFIKNRVGLDVCVNVNEKENASNVVFIEHGITATKDHPYIQAMAEIFSAYNYTVVTFDATNSTGESGGATESLSFFTHYHDLEDVIAWSQNQSWFKMPFALCGHSLGGMASLRYTEVNPEHVNFLVPIAAATNGKNLKKAINQTMPIAMALWEKKQFFKKRSKLTNQTHLVPYSLVTSMDEGDVLPNIEAISCPTHLIVGEKDHQVLPRQMKHLLSKLKCEKSLQVLPKCPHSMYTKRDLKALGLALSNVLEENPYTTIQQKLER
jgi:pimeloyl-ACP methyl ester carboxylesterase